MHDHFIIHRDIKPDNFAMGLGSNKHLLYLIDFGLSKKFRSSTTGHHIKFISGKKLTGTARYASINALRGYEQSRRDDLESIGYVLLYLLRGSLPWQGLKIKNNDDRHKRILEKKISCSPEELGKDYPSEFAEYLRDVKKLDFEENPDYKKYKNMFLSLMSKFNFEMDFNYVWSQNNLVSKSNFSSDNELKLSMKAYNTLQDRNFNEIQKKQFSSFKKEVPQIEEVTV